MATFRETAVTDERARTLLTEYFASRARTFPRSQGTYRTTLPSPEQFVPPRGVFLILVAENPAGEAADVGCGGIRAVAPSPTGAVRYEVKHLWLQPELRGHGCGAALLAELQRRAAAFGATEIVLDTNTSQQAAERLYTRSGYRQIEPFNDNPNATAWYSKTLP